MVEMCRDELEPGLRHQVHQACRIWAAAIADQRELSRLEEAAIGDMALKAVEHSKRLPPSLNRG